MNLGLIILTTLTLHSISLIDYNFCNMLHFVELYNLI